MSDRWANRCSRGGGETEEGIRCVCVEVRRRTGWTARETVWEYRDLAMGEEEEEEAVDAHADGPAGVGTGDDDDDACVDGAAQTDAES